MKTVIIGRTDATLTLNKCKAYLRGKAEAIVDITNDDQRRELAELEVAGFITVIDDSEENVVEIKAPKVIKRQPTEQERVIKAEARTGEMGSRVVISTGNGTAEGKMRRSAIGEISDSDRTKESVEALRRIEKEEEDGEIADDLVINESKLDPSEQMGRKAIISNGAELQSVNMVNKLAGEAKRDPFIDRKDNAEREKILSQETKPQVQKSKEPDIVEDDYVPELSDDDLFIGNDTTNSNPIDDDEDDPFIEV